MAYHAMHALALQFSGSATPPDVHLTSFYVGVLHPLAVIEGLGIWLVLV